MGATTEPGPAAATKLTAEDVWNLPEDERGELIDGELLPMAPVDFDHGGSVMLLGSALLRSGAARHRWFFSYLQTYLERDLLGMGRW